MSKEVCTRLRYCGGGLIALDVGKTDLTTDLTTNTTSRLDSLNITRPIKSLNILGEHYDLIYENSDISGNPKMEDADGYCEELTKLLVINDFSATKTTCDDIENYKKKVVRHEIIHAFLYESGLSINSFWAANEEMVDYFAIQFPKMLSVMKEAGAL